MRYKILLVDDEPNVLKAIVRALRKEPYQFLTAHSADEALAVLHHEPVDVVVSDERMPGMAGTEFLVQVRKLYPHTIRMMLTANADAKTAERALEHGAVFRYFQKPFDPVELGKAIYDGILLRTLSPADGGLRLLMPIHEQEALLTRLGAPKPKEPADQPEPAPKRAPGPAPDAMSSQVREVVEHLQASLWQAQTKEEVQAVFAEIRALLARIQSAEQREEITEIFRDVWSRIESRINR